jgi:2-polyprenyl-3-methyl-5-hydroxy-6-metoxy-1,4-benzoquinol methylase
MINLLKHCQTIAEFGGPSPLFDEYGIYNQFPNIDGYNIFENNYWQKEFKENYRGIGKQFNQDIVEIKPIENKSVCTLNPNTKYDLILCSHVIEHIANPLKALYNWGQILNESGLIFSIIPDKSMMFDCKRPVTSMSHLVTDYYHKTGEEDETHIEEALKLFVNNGEYDYDNYIKSSKNNLLYRAIHHHCFNAKLVKQMFEFMFYDVIHQEQRGMHIITIVKKR